MMSNKESSNRGMRLKRYARKCFDKIPLWIKQSALLVVLVFIMLDVSIEWISYQRSIELAEKKLRNYKDYTHITLNEANIPEASFEDLKETLSANKKLEPQEKEIVVEYIDALKAKYSQTDIRLFNHNLKELDFVYVKTKDTQQKVEKSRDSWSLLGQYDYEKNKVYLYNFDQWESSSEIKYAVLYHELTHVMSLGIIDDDLISFELYGRGDGIREGNTEVFSQYLLSEDFDIHSFLAKEHSYSFYGEIPARCAAIMQSIEQEYSFEDFFATDVYAFEYALVELGEETDIITELDDVCKEIKNET